MTEDEARQFVADARTQEFLKTGEAKQMLATESARQTLQIEAVKQSCEVVKQFITIAMGGTAFVIGLWVAGTLSIGRAHFLWPCAFFLPSTVLGLLYYSTIVAELTKQVPDIFHKRPSGLVTAQIGLVFVGVIFLWPVIRHRPLGKPSTASPAAVKSIQIQLPGGKTLSYPSEADKNYTVEFEDDKVKFTATK